MRLGWETIEEHYQTSQRPVRRWMGQAGGEEEMIARRRGYMRKVYAARGMSHVTGRKPKFPPEMSAKDPALAFVPIRRLQRSYEGMI